MNYFWEKDEVLGKLDLKMTSAYFAVSDLARRREVVHERCCLRHRNWPRGQGVPRARLGVRSSQPFEPRAALHSSARARTFGIRYDAVGGVDERLEASRCGVAGFRP